MFCQVDEKMPQGYDFLNRVSSQIPRDLIIFTISAIALAILSPPLLLPLCVAFTGIFIGKMFVKIQVSTHNEIMKKITDKALFLDTKYPELKRVLIIFTVATSWLNPIAGAVVGGVAGLYIGMLGITVDQIFFSNNNERGTTHTVPATVL